MSGGDDWQVGDLALCIEDSDVDGVKMEVNIGQVYSVAEVHPNDEDLFVDDAPSGIVLILSGLEPGFCSSCFRKIKPDTEPCEEEFTVLIKRMKPAKAPEVAV